MTITERKNYADKAFPNIQDYASFFLAVAPHSDVLKSIFEEFDMNVSEEECKQIIDKLPLDAFDSLVRQTCALTTRDLTEGHEYFPYLSVKCLLLICRHYIKNISKDGQGFMPKGIPYNKDHFDRINWLEWRKKGIYLPAERLKKICELLEKYLEGTYSPYEREKIIDLLTYAYVQNYDKYNNIINAFDSLNQRDFASQGYGLGAFDSLVAIYDENSPKSEEQQTYLYELAFKTNLRLRLADIIRVGKITKTGSSIEDILPSPKTFKEEIIDHPVLDPEHIVELFPYFPVESNKCVIPLAVERVPENEARELIKDPEQLAACLGTKDESKKVLIYFFGQSNKGKTCETVSEPSALMRRYTRS